MKIVLASASERRQELLGRLVEEFTTMISSFDEDTVMFKGNVSKYVEEIALGKANDVMTKIQEPSIIIGADTVVTLENRVLGKPKDKIDACNMLKSLSNKTHQVYTGVVLINTDNKKILKESIVTEVTFSKLTDNDINSYIQSGEYIDKAGAYGIQGKGGIFAKEIRGCYYNVVGLPLNKLNQMIKDIF
ncbi:Maf-like protein [Clostridium vincentii]|uniref:dTTP/UTP pyrophosphatase n=1 Tax=Clostridium vincentii TaxID=52704 RepID=A0A2T0BEW6_9CLOT|nr:Maf-like protein [Clostridium vincentii]PRR82446.1 Maf-like protein YhdE [Clostridium vincentii]